MQPTLALVALLFAAAVARADIVIVQNVVGMAQSGQMTMMVGSGKVRTDVNSQISTITDTATGNVTTLMHAQKAYMVVTASSSKAMMDRIRGIMQQGGAAAASPAPPTATGKTQKINGYNAAEYTFSNANMKAAYWIASDFPNAKMVTDALASLKKGGMADMMRGLGPDLSTLHGVPVKTEVEINGQKITTEFVSAKEQPVDPSEYQIPAGYKEIKMPSFPMQ